MLTSFRGLKYAPACVGEWQIDSMSDLCCRTKVRGKRICQILTRQQGRRERLATVFTGLKKQVKVCGSYSVL